MSNKGKFYMTTAIAYTSGKPHIGNTYEIILADSIARYKRLLKSDKIEKIGNNSKEKLKKLRIIKSKVKRCRS